MYSVFFKQKTAYEMRISDWSSDVCSSDLFDASVGGTNAPGYCFLPETPKNPNCLNESSNSPTQVVKPFAVKWFLKSNGRGSTSLYRQVEIGRASCRERVCKDV